MMEILLATKNKHKIEEIKAILNPKGIQVKSFMDIDQEPDIEETGINFIENAHIKAKAVYERYQIPAMSDDSGLVVPALNGAPGVYSARYAGKGASDTENNTKLLEEMEGLTGNDRKAYFECVILFLTISDGTQNIISASGKVHGHIATEMKGKSGFGYDPLFIPSGHDKTFAELGPAVKNKLSHRKNAIEAWMKKYQLFKDD